MTLPAANAGSPPPAKRPRTESLQATMGHSPPGPSGFGRALEPVPASPVLLSPEASPAQPGSAGGPAAPVPAASDYASRLPAELLDLIFGFLPVSCHGAAAQACRRWYQHLPAIRLELARWLAQRNHYPGEMGWHIMAGYRSRTGPWLAGQGCTHLPLLQCQYHDCLLQGLAPERAKSCVAPRPVRWLAGLVLYSLYQCRVKAPELPFRPVALANRPALIRGITFSTDDLRMALVYHTAPQAPPVLRLYSWTSGGWQQDIIGGPPQSVVMHVCFPVGPVDDVFSCHRNGQLLSWRRQAQTATWYPQEEHRIAQQHRISRVIAFTRGDMVLDMGTENPGEKRLLFCRYDADSQSRDCTTSRRYTDAPYAMAEAMDRLALAVLNRQQDGARLEIHIWKRGLDPAAPRDWGCQVSVLDAPRPPLSLTWSPDRRKLLARVPSETGSRLWILTLDDHCRLRLQAFFPMPLAPELVSLPACELFDSHSSQSLVIPQSLYSLQWCHQSEDGRWQPGARLHTPVDEGALVDQRLRYVRLPGDGRTLVRATEKEVAIWQHTGTGPWQRVVHYRVEGPGAAAPNCGQLADSGLLWLKASGPNSLLRLYGPDSEGRLVRKTAINIQGLVRSSSTSVDGLSQVFIDYHGQALFLHAQ